MANEPVQLRRELGLAGAVVLGLGSMLGTGVYVTIGLAASIAGPGFPASVLIAALAAALGAMSIVALSTRYPVSGGVYVFSRTLIHPDVGFATGWTFLAAKLASASTAAMGITAYIVSLLGLDPRTGFVVGPLVVIALTGVAYAGLLFSTRLVMATLVISAGGLLTFVILGMKSVGVAGLVAAANPSGAATIPTLHAAGLMSLAFSGYGRLATLGEEIRDPERNIPRSTVISVALFTVLYAAVAFVALGAVPGATLAHLASSDNAVLLAVARTFSSSRELQVALTMGALASLVAIVINIVLALSRTVLAMSRNGDLPAALGYMDKADPRPRRAAAFVGVVLLIAVVSFTARTTWSIGSIGLLCFTATTHLAAVRLPPDKQRYPRIFPVIGLLSCAALLFAIELDMLVTFAVIIAVGFAARATWRAVAPRAPRRVGA
ncbi:MAG TPA: APC family permease [Kofleriaceae bacterium]|nr:APC family permease [Kofleriaceae bacterium]